MRIAIGSDHAGLELKEKVKDRLLRLSHTVRDEGTSSSDFVDYPDFAVPVAKAVSEGRADRGILICGTGIGMSIVANKFRGVRAALCHSVETAVLSRSHNDANVLTMGGRTLDHDLALEMVEVWLRTEAMGNRHARRVEKIKALEYQSLAG